MPTFEIRNRKSKLVLGEVSVDDPARVLDGLKDATGCSIEEIAHSLGSTVEEAKANLDISEVREPRAPKSKRTEFAALKRRPLYG